MAATDIGNGLNQPIYEGPSYTDAATQALLLLDGPSAPLQADALLYSSASCSSDPQPPPPTPETQIQSTNDAAARRQADAALYWTPSCSTNPVPTPKIQINSNSDGTEIRFPLGGNVFATVGHFRGKAMVSVRQFYRPRPNQEDVWKGSKKGVVLTPEQWRTLKRNMSGVSAALLACTFAAMPYDATLFSPRQFHLGNLTYTTVEVFRGVAVVALREFFRRRPDDAGSLLPGKRGLNLSSEQWYALEAHSQKMDAVLEAVTENDAFLTDKFLADIVGL